MKIAALGDIHGNYQAFIAVLDHIERWHPDLVLILGDIVNRGPRSKECLHLILEKGQNPDWHIIKGNHEGYVLRYENPETPRSGIELELRRIVYWTYNSLSKQDIQDLINLPEDIHLELPGNQVVNGLHASKAGDRIGIYPGTLTENLPDLINPEADLFLVGHTHQPFIRQYKKTTLINTGSVGLPFDGDTRAGYAQMIHQGQGWQGEIIRIKYDRDTARDDYTQTGFIPDGGEMAKLVLTEFELGWPQLQKWIREYEYAVREKRISLKDAVDAVLENPNIEYWKSNHYSNSGS